jgi:oligopeptide/dipeptide ABC transporter ATP-binding protein
MLLTVDDLHIYLRSHSKRPIEAVRGLSFTIKKGQSVGLVGESGCGKSLTLMSLLGLLPSSFEVKAKRLLLEEQSLHQLTEHQWRKVRGLKIGMIFQNPSGRLNPSRTLFHHFREILPQGLSSSDYREQTQQLLTKVGLSDTPHRLNQYPHQLSGGQSQRVMIALALARNPQLLLADEPTTALDVTIQAQIMSLLNDLQKEEQRSLLLVGHNLALIRHMVSHVLVMYAGEIVESGPTEEVLSSPQHPYTQGLLLSHPQRTDREFKRLNPIPGQVPSFFERQSGCQFAPRCSYPQTRCQTERPYLFTPPTPDDSQRSACFFPLTKKAIS